MKTGNGRIASADPGAPLQGSGNPPATFTINILIPTGALKKKLVALQDEGFVDAGAQYATTLLGNNSVRHLRPYLEVAKACPAEAGPTLAKAHDVMQFDRLISSTLLMHVGVLESRLRAEYSYHMEDVLGEMALYDSGNFLRWDRYFKTMCSFEREVGKGARKSARLKAMLRENDGRLPIEEGVEHMSFGTLVSFFANTASNGVTERVAASFNSRKSELVNWLKCVMSARNSFAHFEPFIVRKQLLSIPVGVRDVDYDRMKPFYLVPLMMRLLAEDPRFVDFDINQGILFRTDVDKAIQPFWDAYEETARFLDIPENWVGLMNDAGNASLERRQKRR